MKRFRLYYDKDLEEAWLQEMDAAGWALQLNRPQRKIFR